MQAGRVIFRLHAIRRMYERGIGVEDIRCVLTAGKVIEEYPDDTPYPSYLMLGWVGTRPLHVVVAVNPQGRETILITVYEPDLERWELDRERRRT